MEFLKNLVLDIPVSSLRSFSILHLLPVFMSPGCLYERHQIRAVKVVVGDTLTLLEPDLDINEASISLILELENILRPTHHI